MELRAATDLGRLWATRGETARAAALLRPICEFFTEGLGNQDLLDAKALMATVRGTT
jgi:predicted ATPase